MRFLRLFFIQVTALLLATAAAAQTVRWEPHEDPNGVRLIFENCAPDGEPQIPSVPGTTFTLVDQARFETMINFQVSRTIVLAYLVRGPRKYPAFTVKTDKGPIQVSTYTPPQTKDSVATARFVPERTTVWAGEVFNLTYIFSASRRHNPQPQPTFDWNPAPFVAEDWPKFEFSEAVRNGDPRIEFTYRTRLYAKTPNTIKLEAASHLLHIQTGGVTFLSQMRMEPVSVTSDQPTIEVKPLPPAPAGFGGAVGQFNLVSRVVPDKAGVGEPVTWTLELAGSGNWPEITALPQREVSGDFHAVQPKPKRTVVEGKLFDATLVEDVVLVPKKAGTYTLGPITFDYFEPKSGTYKKVTTPAHTITIAPPPPDTTSRKAEKETPADSAPRESALTSPASPAPPAGIPRDPLRGSEIASAPMPLRTLVAWLIAPAPALALLWLALAIRRAKKTDPHRGLRETRVRLMGTLQALQAATDPRERATLLHAWQRDTALLWHIGHAAPSARAVPDAAWSTLWTEAERALYGSTGALPSDWIARAQEAAAAKRIPGFQPLRLFLPQNLFPFAALLALGGLLAAGSGTLLLAAATAVAPRTDPLAAYRAGDFAAAEKTWRATVASLPTDWIARHNLSLALAQQDRAGEAAAQATAAFVQNPRDPAVRWHFALAAEKAGFAPADLEGFLTLGPRHSIARLASPSEWQHRLIAATWLAALGLALVLVNAYGSRRWPVLVAGLLLALGGTFAAGLAAPAYTTYGVAGDVRAVIVARAGTLRSIPTETDTTQKTTPLAAGSTAIAVKVFPDRPQDRWVQLEFENGQTGWVRKEDVVGLWK